MYICIYVYILVYIYIYIYIFCQLADFTVSRNTHLFVHERLTNLLPRTFLYNFIKETFPREKN